MLLRFLGFAHTDTYRGHEPGCQDPWKAREARDVPAETADRLMQDFPDAFTRIGGRPRSAAVPAPQRTTAIGSPEARDPLDLLDCSVRNIRRGLSSGEFDASLDALQAAEESGKTRSGVIQALLQRRAATRG